MKRIQQCVALAALMILGGASLFAAEMPEPIVVIRANEPVVFRFEMQEGTNGDQHIKCPTILTEPRGHYLVQASGSFDLERVDAWSAARKEFISFIISDFLEFDLDFEGGTWDQLVPLLIEKLQEAYRTQVLPITKGFMPEKLDLTFESVVDAKLPPRFGAIRQKACSLRSLALGSENTLFAHDFTVDIMDPLDAAIRRATALGNATQPFDSKNFPKISIKAPHLYETSTAYNNLNELAQRPNTTVEKAAADLAALFEISWKLNRPVVFAKTRLHPETGILIVQGSSQEIEEAEMAFRVLTGKKRQQPTSADVLLEKLGGLAEVLQRREEAKEEHEKAEQKKEEAKQN